MEVDLGYGILVNGPAGPTPPDTKYDLAINITLNENVMISPLLTAILPKIT